MKSKSNSVTITVSGNDHEKSPEDEGGFLALILLRSKIRRVHENFSKAQIPQKYNI
jgi:hypothetical protein